MGACAVLLFAVLASPLAQPWSIIGGNLMLATVGVTCALLVHDPIDATALAAGVAICTMFALRCVHPPSGAGRADRRARRTVDSRAGLRLRCRAGVDPVDGAPEQRDRFSCADRASLSARSCGSEARERGRRRVVPARRSRSPAARNAASGVCAPFHRIRLCRHDVARGRVGRVGRAGHERASRVAVARATSCEGVCP